MFDLLLKKCPYHFPASPRKSYGNLQIRGSEAELNLDFSSKIHTKWYTKVMRMHLKQRFI